MKFRVTLKKPMKALAVLLIAILAHGSALAATYWVSTSGSDGNGCNASTSPLTTTAKRNITGSSGGLSCLSAGDTLFIRTGTYSEAIDSSVSTRKPPSGTGESNRTRVSAWISGGVYEVVTLNGVSNDGVVGFRGSGSSYITIEGLILDGRDLNQVAGVMQDAHHIRFLNVEVKRSDLNGYALFPTPTCPNNCPQHVEIIGGKIWNNQAHGIYMSTSNNLVSGVEITANGGLATGNNHYGVHIYDGNGFRANNNIIMRNVISGHTLTSQGGGILLSSGTGNWAFSNIIYGNVNGIVVCCNSPSAFLIYNNTIYNNANFGVEVQTGSNHLVRNNIVRLSSTSIRDLASGTTISNNHCSHSTPTGCSNTDPLFTNAANGDFRLSSLSPAINAGATVLEVKHDFWGTPRPQGIAYDVGAYEYLVPTTLAPPSGLAISPSAN